MHMVAWLLCMWGTWGLFVSIQAALFCVVWTYTCGKLFHNNSRQTGERVTHIKWYWGTKRGKSTKLHPPKKTIEDIQRLFPLFTFSGLEVKANIHPKKNQSRHPSEGLYGCHYNPNSVFIASCLTWHPVKCMVQWTTLRQDSLDPL